jgi:hypothetical protein
MFTLTCGGAPFRLAVVAAKAGDGKPLPSDIVTISVNGMGASLPIAAAAAAAAVRSAWQIMAEIALLLVGALQITKREMRHRTTAAQPLRG